MEPQRLFVLARVRSGTAVFRAMLRSHPELRCLGEILNEGEKENLFNFLKEECRSDPGACLPSNRLALFERYLDNLSTLVRSESYVSYDLKYESLHLVYTPWKTQMQIPPALSLIKNKGWRLIHITRRNHLRRLVSNQYAVRSRRWKILKTDATPLPLTPITVHTNNLLARFEANSESYDRTSRFFSGYPYFLELEYDDMFIDKTDGSTKINPQIAASVAGFLGVQDSFDLEPRFRQMNTWDLREIIANYEEVKRVLQGSRFESFLSDRQFR